ncbi:uncharacterized protein LOC110894188 isoform X2 [Helianthus annuus]|uniref:uncharacterized protein LOC110894188 isoform X2 n=1 Tax=Helianthus annuus TaxID=4232 RepID=UPI000B8F441F|nr:uncharacterized protein LOC110894188 isoform X2 [Helianthus annuus]
MKVPSFRVTGTLQLSTTSTTTISINPSIQYDAMIIKLCIANTKLVECNIWCRQRINSHRICRNPTSRGPDRSYWNWVQSRTERYGFVIRIGNIDPFESRSFFQPVVTSSSELSCHDEPESSPEATVHDRVKRQETEFVSCKKETGVEESSSEFEKLSLIRETIQAFKHQVQTSHKKICCSLKVYCKLHKHVIRRFVMYFHLFGSTPFQSNVIGLFTIYICSIYYTAGELLHSILFIESNFCM